MCLYGSKAYLFLENDPKHISLEQCTMIKSLEGASLNDLAFLRIKMAVIYMCNCSTATREGGTH